MRVHCTGLAHLEVSLNGFDIHNKNSMHNPTLMFLTGMGIFIVYRVSYGISFAGGVRLFWDSKLMHVKQRTVWVIKRCNNVCVHY